jgi:hypothetical protein
MKKILFLLVLALVLAGCKKISTNDKINIHVTNNRSTMIHVEFRAGSTVCSNAYVPANEVRTDDAYKGEYDVYVATYSSGVDGPFSYNSHGLFYSDDNYVTVN